MHVQLIIYHFDRERDIIAIHFVFHACSVLTVIRMICWKTVLVMTVDFVLKRSTMKNN